MIYQPRAVKFIRLARNLTMHSICYENMYLIAWQREVQHSKLNVCFVQMLIVLSNYKQQANSNVTYHLRY